MLSVGDLASWGAVSINMPVVSPYVPDSVRFSSDVDDFTVSPNDIGALDDVHDSSTAHAVPPSLFVDIGDTLKSCDKLLAMISDVNRFAAVPPLPGVPMTIDRCTSSSIQSLLILGRFDDILGDVPTDIGVVAGLWVCLFWRPVGGERNDIPCVASSPCSSPCSPKDMDAPMDMLMEFSRDVVVVVVVVVVVRFLVVPARPFSSSSSRAGMFSRNLIFGGR